MPSCPGAAAPEAPPLQLLTRDPKQRLGSNGGESVREHPWLASLDWDKVLAKEYDPEFKPPVSHSSAAQSPVTPPVCAPGHERGGCAECG